jgi:hypothetical protein
MDAEVSTHTFLTMIMEECAKDMRVTQDLNSSGEVIAHAQCSVDEKE